MSVRKKCPVEKQTDGRYCGCHRKCCKVPTFLEGKALLLTKKVPSKHLLVLKTSWRCLQDKSLRRLQNVFSVTIFRLPRRPEDALKTSWRRLENVLEDKKLLRWRCLQDMSSRCLQDMSSRRFQDVYWEYLLLKNLKSVSDKSVSYIYECKMH